MRATSTATLPPPTTITRVFDGRRVLLVAGLAQELDAAADSRLVFPVNAQLAAVLHADGEEHGVVLLAELLDS